MYNISRSIILIKNNIPYTHRYDLESQYISSIWIEISINKLGARTLGAHSRGSKNVTYRQQTTDKKVNTEPL